MILMHDGRPVEVFDPTRHDGRWVDPFKYWAVPYGLHLANVRGEWVLELCDERHYVWFSNGEVEGRFLLPHTAGRRVFAQVFQWTGVLWESYESRDMQHALRFYREVLCLQ